MTIQEYNLETWQVLLIGAVVLVEVVLKGFALWRAAHKDQPVWFVVLLLVNTAGILPLVYLLLNKVDEE